MSQQRVIDYHLTRLKDRKTDVRLDALHQLSLLKPDGYIETTKSVFQQDADAGVREAARKLLMQYYVEQLKSEQSEQRSEALRQYVTLNGAESMQVAYTVYNNDADGGVRTTARSLLVENYIDRLKSGDVPARSEAIDRLEQLNADESLDILQKVYSSDDDAEVRRLAQKAGRTIFMNTRQKRAGTP